MKRSKRGHGTNSDKCPKFRAFGQWPRPVCDQLGELGNDAPVKSKRRDSSLPMGR